MKNNEIEKFVKLLKENDVIYKDRGGWVNKKEQKYIFKCDEPYSKIISGEFLEEFKELYCL